MFISKISPVEGKIRHVEYTNIKRLNIVNINALRIKCAWFGRLITFLISSRSLTIYTLRKTPEVFIIQIGHELYRLATVLPFFFSSVYFVNMYAANLLPYVVQNIGPCNEVIYLV